MLGTVEMRTTLFSSSKGNHAMDDPMTMTKKSNTKWSGAGEDSKELYMHC